jgi:hypothetical protein
VAGGGVERVPSPGEACWICGLPAVCGERLPGRRHKVRALCQSHADAVFGLDYPAWKRLDAKSQREIADEWLRAMTVLAHGGHRPPADLLAEIAAANQAGTETVRLMSPLMPERPATWRRRSAPCTGSAAARPWSTPRSPRSSSTGTRPPPGKPAAKPSSDWR